MLGNKTEICFSEDGKLYLMGGHYKQDMQTILRLEPEAFEFNENDSSSFLPDTVTIRLVRNLPSNDDTLFDYAVSLENENATEKNIPLHKKLVEYLAEKKLPDALKEICVQKNFW